MKEEQCEECLGYGWIEFDTSYRCTRSIGDCCGGCTEPIECPECGGLGFIEIEENN
jgi:hypothetical protein